MSISYVTEISFGSAVTNEICQVLSPYGFSGAPLFPNLRQEGHLGYDVKIPLRGFPLFLQFKLSDKMSNKRAKEWRNYNAPYFRVHLHNRRHSNQHQLLQELAKEGHYVCYVAPLFLYQSDLDKAFRSNPPQVVRNSMFIEVNRLPPLPDDRTHYFTFLRGDDLKFWSEPVNIEGKFTGDLFLDKLVSNLKLKESLRKMDLEYFHELRASILKIIGPIELPLENKKEERDPIDDIIYLCRVYLGCEVLFVGLSEREKKPKERILRLS